MSIQKCVIFLKILWPSRNIWTLWNIPAKPWIIYNVKCYKRRMLPHFMLCSEQEISRRLPLIKAERKKNEEDFVWKCNKNQKWFQPIVCSVLLLKWCSFPHPSTWRIDHQAIKYSCGQTNFQCLNAWLEW